MSLLKDICGRSLLMLLYCRRDSESGDRDCSGADTESWEEGPASGWWDRLSQELSCWCIASSCCCRVRSVYLSVSVCLSMSACHSVSGITTLIIITSSNGSMTHVILQVYWFPCSFVMLTAISRKLLSQIFIKFGTNVHYDIEFWEVKVKVQGQ